MVATSCTSKFSVLGEQSKDTSVPTVVDTVIKPKKRVFAITDITALREQAEDDDGMQHRNDSHSIRRALFCDGIPLTAIVPPGCTATTKNSTTTTAVDTDSNDKDNITTTDYDDVVVTLWKAVDDGTLRSLPMEYVRDGAALVQELQRQQLSDTTIQLALAMYCGVRPAVPAVVVDESSSSSSSAAAVFLGDLHEVAVQREGDLNTVKEEEEEEDSTIRIQEVPAAVENSNAAMHPQKCDEDDSTVNNTTSPSESSTRDRNQPEDFVTSLLAKWKAVETGQLRSLPMEAPTPEQLQDLLERSKGDFFSSTTVFYMEAMYGGVTLMNTNTKNNSSIMPGTAEAVAEKAMMENGDSNETSTKELFQTTTANSDDHDAPVPVVQELLTNGIQAETTTTPATATTTNDTLVVTDEKQVLPSEPTTADTAEATTKTLPVSYTLEQPEDPESAVSADAATTAKEYALDNKKTTFNNNNNPVIAAPSELAALWSTVDAGTSKSLPIHDVSRWSTTATKEFLDQLLEDACLLSAPTVDLMDAMYQFSKHNDSAVREGYQELVVRSSTESTVPDRITVVDSSSENSPAASVAETAHHDDEDDQEEQQQARGEDELLVNTDPVVAVTSCPEAGLDEIVPAPDTPSTTMSPSQLSRANTPILSNRTADKEVHSNDTYGGGQLLEQVHEEKQYQHLPKQPKSPTPVRPAPPSYSEMAKKIGSVTTPKRGVPAKPIQNVETIPTVPKSTGKRFVASLSAVVSEKSSPSAPPTPSRGLESLQAPIIVLYSSQATHAEVIRQQTAVRNALTEQGIKHEAVDGASNKTIRNALFELSGRIGEYPQIFQIQQDSTGQKSSSFWGGYERFVVDDSLGVDISAFRPKTAPESKKANKEQQLKQQPKRSVRFATSKKSNKMSDNSKEESLPNRTTTTTTKGDSAAKSEITFYGATSFVAKHALDYMMQVSLTIPGVRKITLAGRNETKVNALKNTVKEKMGNLCAVNPKHKGKCVFDVFICDSCDEDGLRAMCQRTKVVANFAGPFERFSSTVVAACAAMGTDYVDITGEVHWAGTMRLKYGELAEKSGARIISFCGFDSIPSDLAIFVAVDALKKKSGGQTVEVQQGTCWHHCLGMANGGTIQTTVEMPLNIRRCLLRWVPFLLEDPLALAHPRIRLDKESESRKNRMAWAEWMNQLPSMDAIFMTGFSGPFFMAPLNTKIVNASSVALQYGPKFTYRERFIPLGFTATRGFGFLSLIPVLAVQCMILLAGVVLKFPVLGGMVARWALPAGTGSSDQACQQGFSEVYAEVQTEPTADGKVDRGNCVLRFEGDPGNWTTAQCVCESALTLLLDRQRLPPRSADGFGTPAELLGTQLLKRLKQTTVRPVEIATYVRKDCPAGENFLCHFK